MKFRRTDNSEQGGAPSSTLGIMRFFDVEVGGPKIGPEFIVGIAIAFSILVIILKFTSA